MFKKRPICWDDKKWRGNMANRDDEYYDRGGRRPSQRDDRYRDDMKSSGRGRDSRPRRDYDDYDERPARRREPEGRGAGYGAPRRGGQPGRPGAPRNGKKNNKALILLVSEIAVALLLLVAAYNIFFKMGATKVGRVNLDESEINDSISDAAADSEHMKGYTNIALFGVDSRKGQLDKKTRTDSIIICSINNDTGEIKLCSVYRDTWLNLSDDSYDKCNAAYVYGGPEQAIKMLNMNLDMDIKHCYTIGFRGLTDVVDALGGVEIDVPDNVVKHLNNYENTMAQELKMEYKPVEKAGLQKLTGLQATAYCRVRYTANGDIDRAARQREVIQACLEEAKKRSPAELEEVAEKIFKESYTTLNFDEIVKLLKNVPKYEIVDQSGFPNQDMINPNARVGKKSVVAPVDLESNVKWLHGFLFNDTEYAVSEDVKKYSQKISADTGTGKSN